jgi:glycosyltransferase involved in cell wall biosynthesis
MKISYIVLTHDEGEYIERLLSFLVSYIRPEDEIVVLDDYSVDSATLSILEGFESRKAIKLFKHKLNGDFAEHRNFAISKADGDWILFLDADEMIADEEFIKALPEIIHLNPEIDAYALPRINTVAGLTEEHVKKWHWQVNEKGWVNWPDYQVRLFKKGKCKYANSVHEKLIGADHIQCLPLLETFSLLHEKEITRQEKQNSFYEQL